MHGGGDSGGGGGHHGGGSGGHHGGGGAGTFIPVDGPGRPGPRRRGRRAFFIVWLVVFFGMLLTVTMMAISHH